MLWRTRSANGCGVPLGALPAEKARKRPAPSFRKIDSARIERAELPVQRNSTLKMWSDTASLLSLRRTAGLQAFDDRGADFRPSVAAVPQQENCNVTKLGEIGAVNDRAAVPFGGHEARAGQDG